MLNKQKIIESLKKRGELGIEPRASRMLVSSQCTGTSPKARIIPLDHTPVDV